MEEDAVNILKYMASNGLVANPKKNYPAISKFEGKTWGPNLNKNRERGNNPRTICKTPRNEDGR